MAILRGTGYQPVIPVNNRRTGSAPGRARLPPSRDQRLAPTEPSEEAIGPAVAWPFAKVLTFLPRRASHCRPCRLPRGHFALCAGVAVNRGSAGASPSLALPNRCVGQALFP